MRSRLYVDNGYWTADEWAAFGYEGKAAKLAAMDVAGVWGQASVLAASGRCPLERVLTTWVSFQLIGQETMDEIMVLAGQIRERAA